MDESEQEMRACKKPNPVLDDLAAPLKQHWGLSLGKSTIKRIESYDDANYYCQAQSSSEGDSMKHYLVKFYNAAETTNPQILDGLSDMLNAISTGIRAKHSSTNDSCSPLLEVPSIVPPVLKCKADSSADRSDSQKDYVFIEKCQVMDGTEEKLAVRVFNWIHGTTLDRRVKSVVPKTDSYFILGDVLVDLGRSIGMVCVSLSNFDHAAFHRQHLWDLQNLEVSMPLLPYVTDEATAETTTTTTTMQQYIQSVRDAYSEVVVPLKATLPHSVIMGDCNDANIIVQDVISVEPAGAIGTAGETAHSVANVKVTGLIDFSDAVYTWTINELAIAMAYCLLTAGNYRSAAGDVATAEQPTATISPSHTGDTTDEMFTLITALGALFAGYVSQRQLTDDELRCLPVLIATRLCISITVGAYAISKEPDNAYLRLHALPARVALKFLCTHGAHPQSNQQQQQQQGGLSGVPTAAARQSFQKLSEYFSLLQSSIVAVRKSRDGDGDGDDILSADVAREEYTRCFTMVYRNNVEKNQEVRSATAGNCL